MVLISQVRKIGRWGCHVGRVGVVGIAGLLAGCGQSGPLYHPGEKTPYGPPYYTIFHRPGSGKPTSNKAASRLTNPTANPPTASCQTQSCHIPSEHQVSEREKAD